MTEPEGLAAALLQLAGLTAKLADLDHRESAHAAQIRDRIATLTALANGMKATLDDQAQILAALDGLSDQATELALGPEAGSSAEDGEPKTYQPSAPPPFWKLDGQARDQAITRLRAWVEQVYRPGYGWVSASLGECWEQHPLCLYALDWLSELWSVLYLQDKRTTGMLAGQAEWQTRLLAAAAEQMARETSRCTHAAARNGHHLRAGARR
jgi:hypothetical protein